MKYCSNCGKSIDESIKYCSGCGNPINSSAYFLYNQSDNDRINKKINVLLLIGFILGLISFWLNLYGIMGILACIFSAVGLAKFDHKKENYKWMGIVGLVLGIIGIIWALLYDYFWEWYYWYTG